MARPYRLQAEGCFYHITNRGDDRAYKREVRSLVEPDYILKTVADFFKIGK